MPFRHRLRHNITVIQLDVTSDDDARQAVARLAEAHGTIDYLVNNAGVSMFGAIEQVSLEQDRHSSRTGRCSRPSGTRSSSPAATTGASGASCGNRSNTTIEGTHYAETRAAHLTGWWQHVRELGQLDAAPRAGRLLVLEEFERAQEWVEHNDAPTLERLFRDVHVAAQHITQTPGLLRQRHPAGHRQVAAGGGAPGPRRTSGQVAEKSYRKT